MALRPLALQAPSARLVAPAMTPGGIRPVALQEPPASHFELAQQQSRCTPVAAWEEEPRPLAQGRRPACKPRRRTARQSPALALYGTIDAVSSSDANPTAGEEVPAATRAVPLHAAQLTAEEFAPFGEIVRPSEDGEPFGLQDAQLDLTQGTPRVYIMRLRAKPLKVSHITHHASVTQCLASIGGLPWYIAVAPPSISAAEGEGVMRSKAGHLYMPPAPSQVRAFRVEGSVVLKLHAATWHAGPMFSAPEMDFFNLELADTNVTDHTTHAFSNDGVVFQIVP